MVRDELQPGGRPLGSPHLEQVLEQYLTLRIHALQREDRSRTEQELKAAADAALRTEVGRMVTRLFLLASYALVLGVIGTPQLLATLVNPAELGRLLQEAAVRLDSLIQLVPDALRSAVIGAVGGLAALSFNSTSSRVRFDVGGTLFVGVVVVSILGFASAASTGVIGTLAFMLGLAFSLYVVLEFFRVLRGLDTAAADTERAEPPILSRLAGRSLSIPCVAELRGLGRAIRPDHSRPGTLAFLIVPPISMAVIVSVALADQAGPPGPLLYWVFLSGLIAFIAWCAWACVATPRQVRIPLWSMVGWSSLVLLLVFFTAVSAIFAVAMVVLLVVNLQVVVLGWSRAFSATG